MELPAYLMALAGWLLACSTVHHEQWRVSSIDGTVITTSTLYANLWKECATDSTGVANCRDFPSLLALNGDLQAIRALFISGMALGVISCLLATLGLRCTSVLPAQATTKSRVVLCGGASFIFNGILFLVVYSWYARQITAEFYNPMYLGQKYELGPALYIGWAGSALCVVGGGILCCTNVKKSQHPRGNNKNLHPVFLPPSMAPVSASGVQKPLITPNGGSPRPSPPADLDPSYDKNSYV
ncbi:claudin-10-like [Petromyzon marinus]|uniref:claudin-10-like n=1 Tax=Petromyzon marinus TaxID=7757 RepID=UPI003F715A2F